MIKDKREILAENEIYEVVNSLSDTLRQKTHEFVRYKFDVTKNEMFDVILKAFVEHWGKELK